MADDRPRDKIEQDATQRLADCRWWKSLWDLDLRECLFFATPQRQRQVQSYSPPPNQRLLDAAELNTDLGFELCGDFATEVINTYLPEAQNWCEQGPGMFVSAEQFDAVADKVKAVDSQVFTAIRGSNFYAEISKAFDPSLSIGTVGLWIEPGGPGMPIATKDVPLYELEINLGPDGEIDDRFAVRHTKGRHVRKLVGEEIWGKLDEETRKGVEDKPGDRTEIAWGFWRKWDRFDDVVWQHVVLLKKKLVHQAELVGEGSCPLIVMRWNPNSDWPWGHGPLMQGLPSLRQVDELEIMRIEHAELMARPPLSYPDDSFAAIEQGLEPGMAYPIRPGSEGAIKTMYPQTPVDAANYEYEAKEHRLRKLFYVDFPQQSGDTPPTLGQWLDEMARAQRRIGRPGLPFWREGPAQIFLRFKHLLERAGAVPRIVIDGRAISLMPYNPSQRAAEQQEIAMTVHALQICGQFFPEEFKVRIDGGKTMLALIDKMRVTAMVKFRDQKQIAAAIDQIQKLAGGQQPGGTPKPPTNGAAAGPMQ